MTIDPDERTTTQAPPPAVATSSIGDPGPLAVLAFSATTLMLGLYNADIVDHNGIAIMIPVALALGGFIQIVAAILEVVRGNTFSAAVFGCFGPFWIIYGLIEDKYGAKIVAAGTSAQDAAAVSSALTLFLTVFGLLTVIFLIAALKTDTVLISTLSFLVLAFVLLAFGVHGGHEGLVKASGLVTVVVGLLGFYHGASGVISAAWGREVLPLGHRS